MGCVCVVEMCGEWEGKVECWCSGRSLPGWRLLWRDCGVWSAVFSGFAFAGSWCGVELRMFCLSSFCEGGRAVDVSE